ncbi:MAG: hypothetical protein QM755_21390 [Luteolibacter sp.]
MGSSEISLIVVVFLITVPVIVSLRVYRNDLKLWKYLSVAASLIASWVGFILIRSIREGQRAHDQARLDTARRK